MNHYVSQYYRCPEKYIRFDLAGQLSKENGYFRFGNEGLYYGQLVGELPSPTPDGNLCDVLGHAATRNGITYLPFDITQVADNLRFEMYSRTSCHDASPFNSMLNKIYYFVRPLLPVAIRKHLQKARLSDWNTLTFPRWPVDRSVDVLFEQLLLISLRSQALERIPFIWFWPDGAPSCAVMTHDVESTRGRDFCPMLMDINDDHGIKSSFCV